MNQIRKSKSIGVFVLFIALSVIGVFHSCKENDESR